VSSCTQTKFRRSGDIIELLDFDGSFRREMEAREEMKLKKQSMQVMVRRFHEKMGRLWKAHYEDV
jgi:hypothetical protein